MLADYFLAAAARGDCVELLLIDDLITALIPPRAPRATVHSSRMAQISLNLRLRIQANRIR